MELGNGFVTYDITQMTKMIFTQNLLSRIFFYKVDCQLFFIGIAFKLLSHTNIIYKSSQMKLTLVEIVYCI